MKAAQDSSHPQREPDLVVASEFLEALDPKATAFTWQAIPDRGPALPWHAHAPLAHIAPRLRGANRAGAGVFTMINQGDGSGRSTRNVTRVRALFYDTDGAPVPDVPLDPHILVESSPDRYHGYLLIRDVPLEAFGAAQVAIANEYGTDSSVKDLPRVMRVPGFLHQKCEPFRVQLVERNIHAPYLWAKVLEEMPFIRREIERHKEARKNQTAREAANHSPTAAAAQILLATIDRARRITPGGTGRHDLLKWAAVKLKTAAVPRVEAETVLNNAAAYLPPRADGSSVPRSEITAIIDWAFSNDLAAAVPWTGRRRRARFFVNGRSAWR